jgi:hypothetical protein
LSKPEHWGKNDSGPRVGSEEEETENLFGMFTRIMSTHPKLEAKIYAYLRSKEGEELI